MRFFIVLPLVVAVTVAVSVPVRLARADPGSDARVLAESLFREGRKLMDAGQIADGCRKLEASQRLDPAPGTLLALATCHEEEGRSATAWSEFSQALSVARRDGRTDRAQFAADHIKVLEGVLPRLEVAVPQQSRVPGLVILRNGAELNEAAWGSALPADPGRVVVEARAPGRRPWKVESMATSGATVRVSIPLLEVDRVATVVLRPDAPADGFHPARRTTAIVVAGVSLIALGVGAYAGVRTLQKRSDSDAGCPTLEGEVRCSEQGAADNRTAQTSATIANVAIGVGAVGALVAGYLWLTAGSPPRRTGALGQLRVVPSAALHELGGSLQTVW